MPSVANTLDREKAADEQELEDLEELVATRGWKRLLRRFQYEYRGEGFFSRLGNALARGEVDTKALYDTSVGIERFLRGVTQRIDELKAARPPKPEARA